MTEHADIRNGCCDDEPTPCDYCTGWLDGVHAPTPSRDDLVDALRNIRRIVNRQTREALWHPLASLTDVQDALLHLHLVIEETCDV